MTSQRSPMIMEEVEDPIASNFSTLAIYLVKIAVKSWYPECLVLPKTMYGICLIRNVLFHNLPLERSGTVVWVWGACLVLSIFWKIFRCSVSGKVDCWRTFSSNGIFISFKIQMEDRRFSSQDQLKIKSFWCFLLVVKIVQCWNLLNINWKCLLTLFNSVSFPLWIIRGLIRYFHIAIDGHFYYYLYQKFMVSTHKLPVVEEGNSKPFSTELLKKKKSDF